MGKISSLKRNNQKKNKSTKNPKNKKSSKVKNKNYNAPKPKKNVEKAPEKEIDENDYLDMIEDQDLKFIKQAANQKSYSMFKNLKSKKGQKKSIEEEYQLGLMNADNESRNLRMMLPIKIKDKIIERCIEVKEEEIMQMEEEDGNNNSKLTMEENDDQLFGINQFEVKNTDKSLTLVQLFALREKLIRINREKVAILCSNILENPDQYMGNIKKLLDLLNNPPQEIWLSLNKLVITSLLEVFKDLLPSYALRDQEDMSKEVKLKKDTLKLIKFEEKLLASYKKYLQKLEQLIKMLTPKKGNTVKTKLEDLKLSEVALNCLCQLLIVQPYFNYSKNIIHLIIPLMNHRLPEIREIVCKTIKTVFNEDKKAEVTLIICQKMNSYIKRKPQKTSVDCLETLLSLKIKDVNLDQEKEEIVQQKKFSSHKNNIIKNLSKRQHKRKKRLAQLEKEMLEAKGVENQTVKQKAYTEITKLLFAIYFRILKQYDLNNVKLLSITLEGIAKFAYLINLEYYNDLIQVINRLLQDDYNEIGVKEKLNCILTVLRILYQHGGVFNIDPLRFYTHLYNTMLAVHIANDQKQSNCNQLLLDALEIVLIKRYKSLTEFRSLAFIKRIITQTLTLNHNVALSNLCLVRNSFQFVKWADILLDNANCENIHGGGIYNPEIEDPEFCNAKSAAIWELSLLQNHYHPIVKKLSENIANGNPSSGEHSLPIELKKLTILDYFNDYNPCEMSFRPSVPPPLKKNRSVSAKVHRNEFLNKQFEKYCDNNLKIKSGNGDLNFFNNFRQI